MRRIGSPDSAGEDRPKGGGADPSDPAVQRAELGFYAVQGLQFGAVLLAFTALGYWLDTRLHTLPLLTVLGALIGGGGGFVHLYRSVTASGSARDRAP